ncbi:protein HIGH ARSENIC CONTENT 1, mitochondrial-like isoform X1 [Mangifera indica]|uniref:protein HIGH ARSENIC CONTENT 1, mitochondrial-like isoform X1 n=1 Tax=Mangifera indica TaxID=29780 RepID=UPI001CF99B09|nr:protein HIGH ARSENIC CONTENT 1, mitochondrial-like isoform X1 [Mangifera indica]
MLATRNVLALTKMGNMLFPIRFVMNGSKKLEDVVTVDVHAAKELLRSGHKYLDVRTIEEFQEGHIENAQNVPYMFKTQEGRAKNPEFITQVSALFKKDDPLVVGCKSGVRSLKACVDLLNSGFEKVTDMGGGYSEWVDKVHPGHNPSQELKTIQKVSSLLKS